MSEYVQKRIDYINNWPDVTPFQAEVNYKKRCDGFIEKNNRLPFSLVKLWVDNDEKYNKSISHFIDSLDVIPYHPNHAFSFAFSALDYYCKTIYSSNNTTICLKKLADEISDLAIVNNDVNNILDLLFSAVPVSALLYLYKCLEPTSRAYTRCTRNTNNRDNSYRKNIIDSIFTFYGYDTSNFNASIRQAALLYRKTFRIDNINVDGSILSINNDFRLHILISGLLYSLRNDSFHGSSMSSTKSSLTSPERYALNYYSYLATYTLLMIVFIEKTGVSTINKTDKFTELKSITIKNVDDFRALFGNHIQ